MEVYLNLENAVVSMKMKSLFVNMRKEIIELM